MISHKYKIIFIHIPRTGGTSIEKAFDKNMWKNAPLEKHLSAKEARKKYGKKAWEDYFTFSFVRNPWDRVISLWKIKTYGQDYCLYDFLLNYNPKDFEYKSPYYEDILNLDLDFVGKFENLQEDFNKVCDKIGIKSIKLPHAGKSDRKHYSHYYDGRTKSIISYLYRKDIRKFNYVFEDKSKSIYENRYLVYSYHIIKFKIDRINNQFIKKISRAFKLIRSLSN